MFSFSQKLSVSVVIIFLIVTNTNEMLQQVLSLYPEPHLS